MDKYVYSILERRYFKNGEKTWDDLVERVSSNVATNNSERQDYTFLLKDFWFLPNTPTLSNAGLDKGQLSACFVLPVGDSMEEIFDSLKLMALIHKTGGGTGFCLSNVREAGSPVGGTKGIASGPLSFLEIFDVATEQIKQGGIRRGANIAVIRIDHPDIDDFISVKLNRKKFNNFNFSVMVSDKFMRALEEDGDWKLVSPYNGSVKKVVRARELWRRLIHNAWECGEPGVLFFDTINKTHTLNKAGVIEATNPCGEQPLMFYESCNLGSINLMKFVNEVGEFDFNLFRDVIFKAVRFLDNVIDVNYFVDKRIEKNTKASRKVGLGVMGLADMLVLMKLKYGSKECLEFLDKLFKEFSNTAWRASYEIARIKGGFDLSDSFVKNLDFQLNGSRNATLTTIAPTGSISILAGVSSGIEPLFKLRYVRRDSFGEREITHPLLNKIDYDTYKEFLLTYKDITPEQHLAVQAVIQKYIDNAVSKTVNLPYNCSVDTVNDIYVSAWKLGCKGITVFREGARRGVIS